MPPIVRTEADIIAKAPIQVTFGEKVYPIKPLTILKQRDWRNLLNQQLASIIANFDPVADSSNMAHGLTGALIAFPEKLTELVFAYAPDLPKEEIMEEATEEQISAAFGAIMVLAFPFLAQLKLVTDLTRAKLSLSQR